MKGDIYMKKVILVLTILISIVYINNQATNLELITIPDSAIRLRVIPNSNSLTDQNMKGLVKEYLEDNVYTLLKDTTTIEEARNIITSHLTTIQTNVNQIFKEHNYNKDFTISFGENYFPNKQYKSIDYQEGYYESLVVYIGEAQGDNWWCVLFPPLCLLEADEFEKTSDVEYSFFVKELLQNIF